MAAKPPHKDEALWRLRIFACGPQQKDFGRSVNYVLKSLSPIVADRLRLALHQAIASTVNDFANQMESAEKGGA